MALSGSKTSRHGTGSHYMLITSWEAEQNISGNSSTVTVTMQTDADSGWSASGGSKPWSMTVNGTTRSGTISSFNISSTRRTVTTQTFTIPHNADGTKSFSISAEIDVNISAVSLGTMSHSYIGTLNTIPRSSTVVSGQSWTTLNNLTVSLDVSSTSFTHEVKWQVQNSSSTWQTVKTLELSAGQTSATFEPTDTVNTNTLDAINGRTSAPSKIIVTTYSGSTTIGTEEKTGTITAPSASTITATDFNIGDPIPFTISRANSGFTHTVTMTAGTYTVSQTGVGASGTITYNPSSLYSQMPTSNTISVTLAVTTFYLGEQIKSDTTKTITGKDVSSNPVFSSSQVSYSDSNTTTSGITGNNQYIISGKSDLRVTINTPATGVNGASITGYVVSVNGVEKTLTSTGLVEMGKITSNTNVTVQIKAMDSRGSYTTVTKEVTMLPYTAPALVGKALRVNGFEIDTKVNSSATYSLLKVGTTNKNTIQSYQYRYRELPSGAWTSYTNLIYSTPTAGSLTANEVTLTLDETKSYEVEFRLIDLLSTSTVVKAVVVGTPLFFIDIDKGSLGFNSFPTMNGTFEMFGKMIMDRNKYATGTNNDAPINFNNSDVIGANGIFFNDTADNNGEGLLFPKTGTSTAYNTAYDLAGWDNFRILDGTGKLNGESVFQQDTIVLWSGAVSLGSTSTITYSSGKTVSDSCSQGIVIIFGDNGGDTNIVPFFIPKWVIETLSGTDFFFTVPNGGGLTSNTPNLAIKIAYLYNTGFKGHTNNTGTAVQDDVYLRYIIGI